RFQVGERVSGSSAFAMGAYQEFVALSETAAISPIPPELSYAEVVGIPTGGFNGLHFVRQCALQPGEHVLINGAAGSIGMFAVQIAKQAGALVTAVDHGDKHAMLRELGADHLLDYTVKDFWVTNQRYDAIIDIVGNVPVAGAAAILNDGGRLMLGNPKAGQVVAGIAENRKKRVRVLFKLAGEPLEDLDWLKSQVVENKLNMVIDRRFPLAALAEAHRYVDSGQKTGVVVIDVSGAADTRDAAPPA
uniref:NAD(P)-dependent alcohol dehydrogenase n=1 Tax=Devosia sp. TaxID=1871048 RepID=UPI003A8E9B1C